MLECMLCSEIVLLLNVADILYAGRLVSEQLVRLLSGFDVHVESLWCAYLAKWHKM